MHPLTWVHRISATVFVVLGLLVLLGSEAPDTHSSAEDATAHMAAPNELPASAGVSAS